ncbi:MAG: hypothetical protein M3Z03_14795 [Actinomycetota bacterium]|nr:hypothetical protein [Actinomycetota bacterium]
MERRTADSSRPPGWWLGPLFTGLARLRGGRRAFHPRGDAWSGWWEGAALGHNVPSLSGRHPALVRVSRGVGLPAPLPDVLGLALRVCTTNAGDVDLLFATYQGDRFPIPWPRRTPEGVVHSTIAAYRSGAGKVRFHASLAGDVITVHEVAEDGRTTVVGTLVREQPVPAEVTEILRFDPSQCGPDLEPVGAYNRWRKPAYDSSQVARSPLAHEAHRDHEARLGEILRPVTQPAEG